MDAILFGIAGFLFVFFHLTGWELEQSGNILWTTGHTVYVLALSLVLGIVVGEGIRFLFLYMQKKQVKEQKEQELITHGKGSGMVWLGSLVLLVAARLPVFLAFYPGICAYDMSIQLGQISANEYNLHHPLAHTLLLKYSLLFGEKVLHNPTGGIACMVFGQILLLSAAMALGIAFLYKKGVRKAGLILLQAFWMFYPFYSYLNISVTKDVLFAVFFQFQMIALIQLLTEKRRWQYELLFVVSTVLMQLFRNNGIYAFLCLEGVFFLCLLFGKNDRKRYLRLFLEGVISLVGGVLCLAVLTRATGAQQGDKRELLSVPIQQLARCMIYHGGVGVIPEDDGTMQEQDRALINDFLLNNSYRYYDEKISDPVKNHTNTYIVRYRTVDFLKTYLHLLQRYPGELVNAFLTLNAGYLYMGDESHGRIYEFRDEEGLSYIHTRWDFNVEEYGVFRHSFAEGLRSFLVKWANDNGHLSIPIVKYFFVPALVFWAYLITFLNLVRKKSWKKCIPYALVAGYYLTLFLGPAVQLRYLFPLLVTLPFLSCCSKSE